MYVVGRNTFIRAGCTFIDFNLLPVLICAIDENETLALPIVSFWESVLSIIAG